MAADQPKGTLTAEAQLRRLLDIMAALRDPQSGCPWDRQQNFDTIAPYTIEEAYEVADAIARRDLASLPDELGDLLLQVVYHARMGEEAGLFTFVDVVRTIADKMVRRHPHVFPETGGVPPAAMRNAALQSADWETRKDAERAGRAETGTLAGVPAGLPALARAAKLTARAARVGFDWTDAEAVLTKLDEEIAELRAELPSGDPGRLADEVETFCSSWRTWPASWTWTPRPACARRTSSSAIASIKWNNYQIEQEIICLN